MKVGVTYSEDMGALRIGCGYKRPVTVQEDMLMRKFTRHRIKEKTGQSPPLDDIDVRPQASDVAESGLNFHVEIGRELYPGLADEFAKNPGMKDSIIKGLREYLSKNSERAEIVNYAISELEAIR